MEPTILSRAQELAAIARFLDAVPEAPSALVLAGPAGIGKTTLWADGVEDAARRGYRVLSARPTAAEARLSYAALTDLAGASFDETRAALPPVQERALAAALLREPTDEAAAARLVATAFTAVLARLAADGPLVVAIDDVQWLDGASRRVLEFAARRLEGPTGLLATFRSDEGDDAPLGLRRALPEERFALLVVGPLSMGALHHLVRERLDVSPPRPVLARIAAASGGNPYFALELARTMAEDVESTLDDPLRVPRTVQELVAHHLESLSEAGREAALVAASLSSPTDELIVSAGVSAAALVEVEQAEVLIRERGRLRFTHPLLASVVYASASEEQRRLVHRRLAEIVVDDEERARHLAQSTSKADATVADSIELGARRAARRGAQDEASELYAAARRLTPANRPNDVARRLLGGAAASNAVGEFATARSLAESALDEAGEGELRAEILTFLARLAWFSGNAGQATAFVDRALQEVADDQKAQGAIHAKLAQFNFAHDLERALDYSDAALGSVREDRDPALVSQALIHRFFGGALRGLGAKRELLERGLELEERARPRLPDGPHAFPLIWFHCVDDFDAARARHAFEDEWYRDRGEEVWVADRLSHLAVAELRAGRWELAERQVEASCTMLDPLDTGGPLAMVFEKRSLVDAHAGRVDRARATLSPLVERFEAAGQRWWAALSLSTLGFAEFAAGDVAAADAAWRRMQVHAEAVGARDILFDRSEPFHIEALLALGSVDGARDALSRLERRGRVLPRPWIDTALPRARALVLAGEGDVTGALALLDDLALDLDPAAAPFEVACTLLVKGRLRRRAKHKRAAADALAEALALFEQLGSATWIAWTTSELDRVGLRRRAPDELTASERKVAELAASGMTNRQVAEAAFVSPKTVEANLARVYRKLGIRSRAELGARLAVEQRDASGQT